MYSLLVFPGAGMFVIRTDGHRSEQVAAVGTVEFGDRVVELLNRHGLVDPDLAVFTEQVIERLPVDTGEQPIRWPA